MSASQVKLQIGGIRRAVRLQFEPTRMMSPKLHHQLLFTHMTL